VYNATDDGIRFRGYSSSEQSPYGWKLYDAQAINVQVEKADGDAMLLEEGATDMQLSHIVLSDSGASGLHLMGGGSEQVTTSHFYDNAEYGVFFDGSGSRTKITNSKIEGNGAHGVYINSCSSAPADVQFVGNNFTDNGRAASNTYSHVYLQSSLDCDGSAPARATRLQIVANNFTAKSGSSAPYARYALRLGSATGKTGDEALVQGNAFGAGHFATGAIDLSAAAKVVLSGNSGLTGWEMGDVAESVTDAGGDATVSIPHGLLRTPTAVSAQPADAATADLGPFYISSVTRSSIVLTYTSAEPKAGTYKYAVMAAVR